MTISTQATLLLLAITLGAGCAAQMEPLDAESESALVIAPAPAAQPAEEKRQCEEAKTTGNKYWPPLVGERDVDIDGHDFDFKKNGEVDGPGSHNGGHSSSESKDGTVTLKVNVGTDKGETNDVDVTVEIDKDGNAKITGTYQGTDIGTQTGTVKDSGNGKFSLTITITTIEDGEPVTKEVTIEWSTTDCP